MNWKNVLILLIFLSGLAFPYTYYNYWIEKDYNINDYSNVWTILNLSTASNITFYVYYGGSTSKSDGSKVFIWFDDFTQGYSLGLLDGQNGWTAEYSGADVANMNDSNYAVITNANRPGYYKTYGSTNALIEFYFKDVTQTPTNNIWIYNTAGNNRVYIYRSGGTWYYYDGASTAWTTTSTGTYYWIGMDITNSASAVVDLYLDRTLVTSGTTQASGDGVKFHWRYSVAGQGNVLKYILARKYDKTATITISYGSEETGPFNVNGESYAKRRQITISTDKDLTDYQVNLNYSYFNDSNILLTDNPSAPPVNLTKTSPTYNQTQYNPVLFEFEVTSNHTIDVCKLNLDGTLYTMTKVNATLCNISKVLAIGNHTYNFTGNATYNPTGVAVDFTSSSWTIEKLPEPALAENMTASIDSNTKTETTAGNITASADKLSNETNLTTEWYFYYNNTLIYNINGTELWNASANYTAFFIKDNNTKVEWKVELIVSNNTTSQLYQFGDNQTLTVGLWLENTYLTNESLLGMNVSYEVNFSRSTSNVNIKDAYLQIINSSNTSQIMHTEKLSCSGLSCSSEFSFAYAGVFNTTLIYNKTYGSSYFDYEYNDSNLNVQDFYLEAVAGETCSANYTKLTTFYTREENNQTTITADYAFDITYKIGVANKSLNASFTNQTNVSICYYPNYGGFYVSSFEEYTKDNYTTRHRFFRNMKINGTLDNTYVYLLNSSEATEVLIQVRENGVTKKDVDVQVLRYFPSKGTYLKIDEARINDIYGKTYVDIEKWYKFKVIDRDGNILYQDSGPTQIVCSSTPCTKTISYSTTSYTSSGLTSINATCEANKTSNAIKCVYIDATGRTKKIHFKILEGLTTICNQTIESSSGEYVCDLTAVGANLSTDVISWTITREASPEILINSGIIDVRTVQSIVYSWIIVALAFVVMIGFSAYYHPGLAVALSGAAIFVLSMLNIIGISMGAAASILLASLIVGWYLSR